MENYNIIGQGTYGYIFYPSLNNHLEVDNTKFISKLLLTEDADVEYKNHSRVKAIDILDEYQLGLYYKTNAIPNTLDLKNMDLFKNYNLEDLSLIITKHGGIDIYNFLKKKKFKDYNDIILFLNEFYRLLKGIKLLNDNNIIHHDINPLNIIYDISNNRGNYIDFGLTNLKENIIKDSLKSNYEYSIFHPSFPLEAGFYNKDIYNIIINKQDYEIQNMYNIIYDNLINGNTIHNYNFNIDIKKIIKAIKELFKYYYIFDFENKIFYVKIILNDLYSFFKNIKNYDYNTFIDKSLNTFDSFGYGITLIYSLYHINYIIPNNLYNDLLDLGLGMSSTNLFSRLTIEEALIRFEKILKDHNIKL